MLRVVVAASTGNGIGASDCELVRDAALAQPVSTLTSLAYVLVGIAVVAAARSQRRAIGPATIYGSCLVAIGAGSVLFHGPQPSGAREFHDLPILIAVIFVVLHDLAAVRGSTDRIGRTGWPMAVGAGVATALIVIDPQLTTLGLGLSVAAIVVLEVAIAKRHLRSDSSGDRGRVRVVVLGIAVVAAGTWILGRTDSPLCNPDVAFQLHGIWHVMSAVVLGLWWWVTFGADSDNRSTRAALRPAS